MSKRQQVGADGNPLIYGKNLVIDPLWCSWFAGFVAGEGCFAIDLRKNKQWSFTSTLVISLRGDDGKVLHEVKERLHCGTVFEYWRPQHFVRYVSARTSDAVNILIPLFDEFPIRNKKQQDYETWREIALKLSRQEHLNGGRPNILEMIAKLRADRKYQEPVSQNEQTVL